VFLSPNLLNAVTYNSDPKIFIFELVEDALKTLDDKNLTQEEKNKSIEEIAKNNVDIRALGLYTLGETRKTLDSNTLERYHDLFEKYLLKSLISRLSDYSSQKFEVIDADKKNAKYTIVNSKISQSSSQPEIKVDWRVYTKDPLKPLIRDLIVEGLSLAKTQKEEFASILNSNNNDINFLFSKLEEFISN
tara:strand:- start:30 stop:599 length:570 start_codon:yes stop_codon:yes gene_type:complete